MKARDLFYEMGTSLLTNKLRTGLTMIGLIIGIASVILMLAAVQGVQNLILSQVGGDKASVVSLGIAAGASEEDIPYLQSQINSIEAIGIQAWGDGTFSIDGKEEPAMLVLSDSIGSSGGMSVTAAEGRLISPEEYDAGAPTVVLPFETATALFSEPALAVGQKIDLNGKPVTVVGVTAKSMFGSGQALMSYKAFKNRYALANAVVSISTLEVRFAKGTDLEKAQQVLKDVVTARYPNMNESEVYTFAYSEIIKQAQDITYIFTALALLIASTSLSVGGIGIMNMMLTNVTERTREIGLRKAVGAKAGSITAQFLGEAIAICLVGCTIAVILGGILVAVIGAVLPLVLPTAAGFKPEVTWWSVVLSVGVSAMIALIFGWYPARRAARLDPVEALRYQ